MAEIFDGEGYWLPSEFLTDDGMLTDLKPSKWNRKGGDDFSGLFGNSFDFKSDLDSSVEFVNGSTETGSDGDEFITLLTREIASSALNESKASSEFAKWNLRGSPQSNSYDLEPVLNRSGAKRLMEVINPPSVSVKDPAAELDLFYAIADEVVKLKMNEGFATNYSPKESSPINRQSYTVTSSPLSATGIQQNRKLQAYLAYQQLRTSQLIKMRSEMVQARNRSHFKDVKRNGERDKTQGYTAAPWPAVRHSQNQRSPSPILPSNSLMKPTFQPDNGAKKERTGTGVFLPRKYVSTFTDTRKKPADSVVHGLNLKLDLPSHAQTRSSIPEYEAAVKQNPNMINLTPQTVINNQEFRLPPEWTY